MDRIPLWLGYLLICLHYNSYRRERNINATVDIYNLGWRSVLGKSVSTGSPTTSCFFWSKGNVLTWRLYPTNFLLPKGKYETNIKPKNRRFELNPRPTSPKKTVLIALAFNKRLTKMEGFINNLKLKDNLVFNVALWSLKIQKTHETLSGDQGRRKCYDPLNPP